MAWLFVLHMPCFWRWKWDCIRSLTVFWNTVGGWVRWSGAVLRWSVCVVVCYGESGQFGRYVAMWGFVTAIGGITVRLCGVF